MMAIEMPNFDKGQYCCHNMCMQNQTKIQNIFDEQAHWCEKLGSPFTACLLKGLGKNLDHSTATGSKILNWVGQPNATGDAVALRLAGALHGLVRAGVLPALSAYYPPHPLPDEKELAGAAMAAIAQADAQICAWLEFAPQTNEVARSSLLYTGMRVITEQTSLLLALFELGASAGLNLMLTDFPIRLGKISSACKVQK